MTVLLFLGTILFFLSADFFLRRNTEAGAARQRVPAFRFPEGIFFSKTHTWLNLGPTGSVQLGIDDFAARLFNAPAVTLLKNSGDSVKKGEPIIRLNQGRNEITMRSPINGTISTRNARLVQEPDVMANDLFRSGWAYTMEPKPGTEFHTFLLGTETHAWLKAELGKLRDFIACASVDEGTGTLVLQDGGEPMPGVLNGMKPEQCKQFEQQFLSYE